MTPRSKRELVA